MHGVALLVLLMFAGCAATRPATEDMRAGPAPCAEVTANLRMQAVHLKRQAVEVWNVTPVPRAIQRGRLTMADRLEHDRPCDS